MLLSKLNEFFIQKPYLALLAVAVFLIKLPPFYVIPSLSLSNSNIVIRGCIIFAFALLLVLRNARATKNFAFSPLVLVLGAYILSQSLSVINAVNMGSFFGAYKDVIMGLLLFLTMLLLDRKEYIFLLKVFIASAVINIVYQYLFIFFPAVQYMLKDIINNTYLQFVNYQTDRGRYFGDTLDEALIPLFFYYYSVTKKNAIKIGIIAIIISIIFLVVMASWRTKFIILIVALTSSFFFYKQMRKYVISLLPFLMIVFIAGSVVSLKLLGQNVYDRFLLTDIQTETHIQSSRLGYLKNAWEVGWSYPLTGAGIGNYFDNLTQKNKNANMSSPTLSSLKRFVLVDDPHNIFFSTFASSGFLGLISLLCLLGYFAVTDFFLFRKDILEKALIFVFWAYFIFTFFNPWLYFAFLVPFWFFRGIIENMKINENN